MLKRPITYTDFNDQTVTEEHYFNLTEAELVELEMSKKGGMQAWIQSIIANDDTTVIFAEFKKIVLAAYGEKTEDGRSFVKTDANREAFSHTGAFHKLLFEVATESKAAADFILGAMPKSLAAQTKSELGRQQDKPVGPPPTPPRPPTAIKPV